MGLESDVSLLVAALDLSLVRLLRDAIRTADIAGGKFSPLGTSAVAQQSRGVLTPEPRIEPRRVFHPTDRYEPRRVLHPTPCIDYSHQLKCDAPCPEPHEHHCDPLALPPPWRIPLDKIPLPPRPVIKVHVHRVDVHNKGSLIDVFL